ncbi:Insulin-degrading enzyme-like 1, peroxisomal [Trifolium repens]|nr:Insulin-degrading enzyme-like 1, peroxisomal [Trifolium repens]
MPIPMRALVVVISHNIHCDPDTDKCAPSMSVGVSYFSDPAGLEGLAHFLEHMLFYASEKYPVEDSYSKYITEHGGSTYAFTSSALDRFAQILD